MRPDGSTLQALAGTVPDAEVAARADVSLEQVQAYRRFHKIPPFVRVPPSTTPRAAGSNPKPERPVEPAPSGRRPPTLAFSVTVSRGGFQASFVVFGQEMVEATGRAAIALQARDDGPWVIEQVSLLGEALGPVVAS